MSEDTTMDESLPSGSNHCDLQSVQVLGDTHVNPTFYFKTPHGLAFKQQICKWTSCATMSEKVYMKIQMISESNQFTMQFISTDTSNNTIINGTFDPLLWETAHVSLQNPLTTLAEMVFLLESKVLKTALDLVTKKQQDVHWVCTENGEHILYTPKDNNFVSKCTFKGEIIPDSNAVTDIQGEDIQADHMTIKMRVKDFASSLNALHKSRVEDKSPPLKLFISPEVFQMSSGMSTHTILHDTNDPKDWSLQSHKIGLVFNMNLLLEGTHWLLSKEDVGSTNTINGKEQEDSGSTVRLTISYSPDGDGKYAFIVEQRIMGRDVGLPQLSCFSWTRSLVTHMRTLEDL